MSEQDFYSQYLKPEEREEPGTPDTAGVPPEPIDTGARPHNGVEPSDAHTDPRMPAVDPYAAAPHPQAPPARPPQAPPTRPPVDYPPAAPPNPAPTPPGAGRHALGAPGEPGVPQED